MNKNYKQVDILDVTFQVHQLSQCKCFDVDGFMCQKWIHSIFKFHLTFHIDFLSFNIYKNENRNIILKFHLILNAKVMDRKIVTLKLFVSTVFAWICCHNTTYSVIKEGIKVMLNDNLSWSLNCKTVFVWISN